jgi:Ca-activated chloride channel homolog
MIVNSKLAVCFIFIALSAVLFAAQQQPKPSDQGEFKIGVEVNMVTVPVTVRDDKGFMKGLPEKAFRIYEDGQIQEVSFFAQEKVPTRIAIILDSSGSVRTEWGTIKYATKKFIENLAQEDEFALVSFNIDTVVKIRWGRKINSVDPVLTSIYCKDNTKLWDAIYAVSASNGLFTGIREKKAIILMSDGLDNDSSVTYEEALQAAVTSEAAVYVVSKTEAVRQMMLVDRALQGIYDKVPQEYFVQADLALRKLAHETGGRVLYPSTFGQLGDVYSQVEEELRNQYTIGYTSTNAHKDGSYRNIEVKVNAPGAQVSARPGYYAPDELNGTKKR